MRYSRPQIANQALVRRMNTSLVMGCIRLNAPLSRAEVAFHTGLNRSTVSSIVDELIVRGFIHETTRQEGNIGRPGVHLQLNPNGGCVVGLEIGVDFLAILLINFAAEILWQRRVRLTPDKPQIEVLELAETMIEEALQCGSDVSLAPLGIGVGIPGLVDANQGKLVFAPNLKWSDTPLRLMWMRRFNLPVFVENEANCGTLCEQSFGVGRDVRHYIYLHTGVGLGGGIVIDGELFRGANGFGGEVGHITLYADGELCGCGRRGCWETYVRPGYVLQRARQELQAGTQSLISTLSQNDPALITLETVVEAARQKDALALKVLNEVAEHLSIGIANLVNIFNPEMVVLGGAFSITAPWIIPVVQQTLMQEILPPLCERVRVEASAQGLNACALGAATLVLNDVIQDPMQTRF